MSLWQRIWPSTWKLSAHSLAKEEEEEDEEDEGECDQEDDGEEGEDHGEWDGVVGEVEDDGHRPFILPLIWKVNDFYPTMSLKVFNNLRTRFQIPNHIPMQLLRKSEKCYLGKTADIGLYDAIFTARLRLLLMELHRQLTNSLGLSVSQIAPNAWRIFIGAEVI